MFPAAGGLETVFAAGAFLAAGSSLAESLRVSIVALVAADLLRPLGVAVGWTLVTLVGGAVLIGALPSATRAIRDDTIGRPDLAFATGFLVFFAPLVAVTVPLFVTMYVDHWAVIAVGALVALPGLLLGSVALLVGGCFGAIIVGDRVGSRVGADSPSLWGALALGTAVLGSSQLVPILGALVAIAMAIIGIGGVVRRRFDPWNDVGRGGDADERDRPGADDGTADGTSTGRNAADSRETEIWNSNEDRTGETETRPATTPPGRFDVDAVDSSRDERERRVKDWEWEIDADRGDDDANRSDDGER